MMPARAIPARAEFAHVPVHVGLSRVVPAGMMPPNRGVLLYNLLGAEYGDRVRLGYREWVTGLTGASDNTVRSVLPFMGSQSTKSRLFACTSSGIWDVTSSTAAPAISIAFADTTGNAGWGVCHTFVNSAGNHFLIYCDEVNGMYVYTESTDTWAKTAMGSGGTDITGYDPANFVFVTSFKQRLWFVERNSTRAIYMPAQTLFGAPTGVFYFGSKFKSGGALRGLFNWTYDGGAGIDDSLVAVSDGGDVAIYQGLDPATASSFNIQGVWSVGALPAGRRIATDFGGELLIMSKTGILPCSKLVSTKTITEESQYETYEIAPLFNRLTLDNGSVLGWSMRLHPEEHALIVTCPQGDGLATNQLAMSMATKGWSQYRDLPIYSNEVWSGKMYFGTTDGRVCVNDGYLDNLLLSDNTSYSDIGWSLLTAFQNLGNGRQKQVGTIRPSFLTDGGTPAYAVEARYRYDFTEIGSVGAGSVGNNAWDTGLWDTATWAGDYASVQQVSGAAGMGPEFAIAAKGTSRARTVIVGFDVSFQQGGFL